MPTEFDRRRDAPLLAIAAAGLGFAIQIRDGLYDPLGFVGLSVALVASLLLYFPRVLPALDRIRPRQATWIFAAAVGFNFLQWLTPRRLPGSWHGTVASAFFYGCLIVAAIVSAVMVFEPRLARPALLVLVGIFCAFGAWVIVRVPHPYMDVWVLQTEGMKAFVHGHNPFGNVFRDPYNRPELFLLSTRGVDGLIHQGFPYPPMVLWLELPGFLISGDYRWANLAAMGLTAILIAFAAPRSKTAIAPLAAALFMFTPRALFVLESGWTEPITALLLAATVFCAARLPRLMPICLGFFLCSKQYLIWAIPPILLLVGPRAGWKKVAKVLAIALAAGCVVSLPLILWDVRAYLSANVEVASGAAFRSDALSYLALWANVTKQIPSALAATAIGSGTAAAATVLVTLRGRRTPAGYAAAVATAHLVFFAFYKFAFCNYDWFLIATFCCAAGAMGVETRSHEGHEERSLSSGDS